MLNLAMMDITKKCEGKPWNWGQILEQLPYIFKVDNTRRSLFKYIKTDPAKFILILYSP